MKLRLRSLESKETLKIEVPTPCSLQHLKETLSHHISSSSSSSASSLHLSLNRKHELQASSPQDSLQSLGITSGDLIFYTLNPNAFSPQTLPPIPPIQDQTLNLAPSVQQSHMDETNLGEFQTLDSNTHEEKQTLIHAPSVQQPKTSDSEMGETHLGESETLIQTPSVQEQLSESDCSESDMGEGDVDESEALDSNAQKEETLENMDIDDGSESGSAVVGKKFSVPSFLRKVLRDELPDDVSDHRLLVIAVHAVLLESGFVGFDSVTGIRVDRFHLPDEWPSNAFTMSLWYTLPELITSGSDEIENVVLKFQSLGRFVNVYGSLGKNGSGLHWVCLDEYRFVQTIDLVWAKCDSTYEMSESDGYSNSNSYPDSEIFEFWKIVKDGLALPLLIDLCDRAGLVSPPCLMRLPTELKLKILELIPGVDVAKVACVCSELRYLSSNSDLWKQKFVEEFGTAAGERGGGHWRERFSSSWESKKKRKRMSRMWRGYPRVDRPFYFPVRRDPNPLWIPGMVGGDYDRFPGVGIPAPFGQPGRPFPRCPVRRRFAPNCNLGGFNS
ncbi:hypothetical protein L1049_014537 [Liquidambar formosana]|uniref:F-box domain-containing protein n=1 Tax=Liquidambar formosana TaxID=63359 RepID=A0AAP0RW22_LIQFO